MTATGKCKVDDNIMCTTKDEINRKIQVSIVIDKMVDALGFPFNLNPLIHNVTKWSNFKNLATNAAKFLKWV